MSRSSIGPAVNNAGVDMDTLLFLYHGSKSLRFGKIWLIVSRQGARIGRLSRWSSSPSRPVACLWSPDPAPDRRNFLQHVQKWPYSPHDQFASISLEMAVGWIYLAICPHWNDHSTSRLQLPHKSFRKFWSGTTAIHLIRAQNLTQRKCINASSSHNFTRSTM